MPWERIELKTTRTSAFARITKGKQQQLVLNKGASELLRKCQWVMIYLDVQKEAFAIEPLTQYEVGACKAHWFHKGGWAMFHHPQLIARMISAGVEIGTRMHVVSDLSTNKQLVFKFAKA